MTTDGLVCPPPARLGGSLALPPATRDPSQLLRRWTLALLLVGVLWRCARYLMQFPIWGDEAFNCLNFLGQDYRGILGPLHNKQVAPLLFWWGELTAFQHLGNSELALRLLPFLAGMGGLLLVWRLASLTLPPLARTFAVGLLAVAIWPVSMSTLLKPYAFDLVFSAGLLVLAVQWLQRPERLGSLLGLVLLVPVALCGSFPSVFVAGSISVALLPAVWRQPGWKARALFAAYNALLLASFAGTVLLSEAQLDPSDTQFRQDLKSYWQDGFPPRTPLPFLKWLALIHTGRLMAYPLGGSNGQSVLTFLLFLAGLWQLWRLRQRALLVLCVGPFVLGFLAAIPQRYPYGGCCRLSQHVAPIICLLAGLGAATLLERLRSDAYRQRWTWTLCGLLALVGIGGTLKDVLHPYRGDTDLWTRRLVGQIAALSSPNDQIVVLNKEEQTDVVFQWYLSRFRGHLGWEGRLDMDRLNSTTGQVWCLNIGGQAPGLEAVKEQLGRHQRTWLLTNHIPYTIVPAAKKDPTIRCDVHRWVNPGSPGLPAHLEAVSCWP